MLQKKSKHARLRHVKKETELGKLFIGARGAKTLREVEEITAINRETWRSIEIGRIQEPDAEIVLAATKLPDSPLYEIFVEAIRADRERRLEAEYGPIKTPA
jgi:hypothetical protein